MFTDISEGVKEFEPVRRLIHCWIKTWYSFSVLVDTFAILLSNSCMHIMLGCSYFIYHNFHLSLRIYRLTDVGNCAVLIYRKVSWINLRLKFICRLNVILSEYRSKFSPCFASPSVGISTKGSWWFSMVVVLDLYEDNLGEGTLVQEYL